MTTEVTDEPKRIFLSPKCCADENRLWCEDDVWHGECEDGNSGIEYIRADLVMTTPSPQTDQVERDKLLKWHMPTMLRWVAENINAPRLPDGTLTGRFLYAVAENIEHRAQAIEIDEGLRSALEQIKLIGENRRAFDDDRSMWEEMERIASVALSSGEGVGG